MTCFLAINIFHFFWTCCWTKEMIYLTKNSSASPQKKDLENSLYKSFATLSNFWYLDIYVQLLSERRCWSKNLSYIRFSFGLFTEVANHFFSDFRFLKKWAWIMIISIHFLFRAGHICQCGTCIKHMSVWHMYQTGWDLILFLLSYFLFEMVSVMNELYCHKQNRHLFDKTLKWLWYDITTKSTTYY